MNTVIRRLAIGNHNVIEDRPGDLLPNEMDRLAREVGELAQSPEDVLSYAMFPEVGREFLEGRRQGKLVAEPLEPITQEQVREGVAATEFNVTMHGETYHIQLRGTGHRGEDKRPFYMTVDGMPEEVIVEALDEISLGEESDTPRKVHRASKRPRASKEGDVTTSMPGTIVDVLVKEGEHVDAGTPVIVTEAMKMETEIQAPVSGTVSAIHVQKGDSVNPDEALIEIERG